MEFQVRTLAPIEEERKDDLSQSITEGKRLSAEVSGCSVPICWRSFGINIPPMSECTLAF